MLTTYKIFDQVLNEVDGLFTGRSFYNPKNTYFYNYQQYRWSEKEDSYAIEMAVPGLTKNDLIVKVEDDILNLEIKTNNTFVNPFQITRTLPENTNIDEMTAKVENGILVLNLPKKIPPPKKTRLISVK